MIFTVSTTTAEEAGEATLKMRIDADAYTVQYVYTNENGEINPIPVGKDVGIDVPEMDTLSNILKEFHDEFGNIEWTDEDKVKKQVAELPDIVSRDERYRNAMKYSDRQNSRDESDRAVREAILATMGSGIELYREFQSNPSLQRWIMNMVFERTYKPESEKIVQYPEHHAPVSMVAEGKTPYGRNSSHHEQ